MHPERIAVKTETTSLSYHTLNQQSNGLAHAILAARGGGEEPIALLFDHGTDMIVAMLGVLKTGKMYVPLNPTNPISRLKTILQDCQAKILLTSHDKEKMAKELVRDNQSLMNLDDLDEGPSDQTPGCRIPPHALAYIMYTSGSTGLPKGVMQNHRNVLHNTMAYTNLLHICAEDKLLLLHSYSYGASINNLFAALLNGATLLPFDVNQQGSAALARFVIQEQVSIYRSVPELFRSFAESLTGTEDFSHIRFVHLSGAPASKWDLELYRKHFSNDCIFVHRLGSTEANTVFLNLMDKDCQVEGNLVPVGTPIDDKQAFLLDESGRQLGPNCTGEIVIQSFYLSPGYWRDPERTQATFFPSPDGGNERTYRTGDLGRRLTDGRIEHLGRKDSRIKIRGHRIEASEIEVTLVNSGRVKAAAVVDQKDLFGETKLAAYVVPSTEPSVSATELRNFLRLNLPSQMVPSVFVFMRSLPLLPNGKLDRAMLPQPLCNDPPVNDPFVPPVTSVEKMLAEIWSEVLGLKRISVKDNFFDLGGHSLLAVKILSRIHERCHVELPLSAFLDSPTIQELALTITEELIQSASGQQSTDQLADAGTFTQFSSCRFSAVFK